MLACLRVRLSRKDAPRFSLVSNTSCGRDSASRQVQALADASAVAIGLNPTLLFPFRSRQYKIVHVSLNWIQSLFQQTMPLVQKCGHCIQVTSPYERVQTDHSSFFPPFSASFSLCSSPLLLQASLRTRTLTLHAEGTQPVVRFKHSQTHLRWQSALTRPFSSRSSSDSTKYYRVRISPFTPSSVKHPHFSSRQIAILPRGYHGDR